MSVNSHTVGCACQNSSGKQYNITPPEQGSGFTRVVVPVVGASDAVAEVDDAFVALLIAVVHAVVVGVAIFVALLRVSFVTFLGFHSFYGNGLMSPSGHFLGHPFIDLRFISNSYHVKFQCNKIN